jgi:hypothetical protein
MSLTRTMVSVFVTVAAPVLAVSVAPLATEREQSSQNLTESVAPVLVEKVRKATQPFLDFRQVDTAGYKQFLGCVSGEREGAMGVHFVNMKYVEDGELDAAHPEALLYESKNGTYRLIGVEFIVMADQWNAVHEEAPVLEGQTFQFNGSPNRYALPAFYELHVWAWRENPNGAFVDWHPHVSCEGR